MPILSPIFLLCLLLTACSLPSDPSPTAESSAPLSAKVAACQLLGCDDDDPCTSDACTPAGCVFTSTLSDGNACTYDDPADCLHYPLPAGASCGGSKTCNGAGDCTSPCLFPQDCPPVTVCEVRTCVNSQCAQVDKPEYAPCGPDGGLCMGGECLTDLQSEDADAKVVGCRIIGCNDDNPCTADTCTSAGCQHSAASDGTRCDFIAGNGQCLAGACCHGYLEGDSPAALYCIPCDDGDPSTYDDGTDGCHHYENCHLPGDACSTSEDCAFSQCAVSDCVDGACVHVPKATGSTCFGMDGGGLILGGCDGCACLSSGLAVDTSAFAGPIGCAVLPAGSACSDGDDPGRCVGGACCTGCVDALGFCRVGATLSNCGGAGEPCASCIDGNECTADICLQDFDQAPKCGHRFYGNTHECALGVGRCDYDGQCCGGCFDFPNGQAECVGSCGNGMACDPVTRVCEPLTGLAPHASLLPAKVLGCQLLGCDDGNDCTADHCTSVGCWYYTQPTGMPCDRGTGVCVAGGVCSHGASLLPADAHVVPLPRLTCAVLPPGSACIENGQPGHCINGGCCTWCPVADRIASCQILGCDDQNSCTVDSCDLLIGCTHKRRPNGVHCGFFDVCHDGICSERCSTAINCPAPPPGTQYVCDDGACVLTATAASSR